MRRFLMLVIVVVVSVFIFDEIFKENDINEELLKIGYNSTQIKHLENNLNDNDIEIVKKYSKVSNITEIISNSNYVRENLDKYLSFATTKNVSRSSVIISAVNDYYDNNKVMSLFSFTSFNENNYDRYISYYEQNKNKMAGDIITFVNKNQNLNSSDNDFYNLDFFISENLERYIDYYNKNQNIDKKEVISIVNSNADYDFYTNIKNINNDKGNLFLVNKFFNLSSSYIPGNLVTITTQYGVGRLNEEAYSKFIEMHNSAKAEELMLKVVSGYRDYELQDRLYKNYSLQYGKSEADTFSARPGHSEHQTGLAIDINSVEVTFENTKEFSWLKDNAHKYGFILRYPKNKEYLTGYSYEPWHYRYLGVETATKVYESGLTYEEYYAYYLQ